MVPTLKSKTLITDLYSMNPPDSRVILLFTILYNVLHGCFLVERLLDLSRQLGIILNKIDLVKDHAVSFVQRGLRIRNQSRIVCDLTQDREFVRGTRRNGMLPRLQAKPQTELPRESGGAKSSRRFSSLISVCRMKYASMSEGFELKERGETWDSTGDDDS
jgi:hypothetical protein